MDLPGDTATKTVPINRLRDKFRKGRKTAIYRNGMGSGLSFSD